MEAILHKTVTYKAEGSTNYNNINVARVVSVSVGPRSILTWRPTHLVVPKTHPTSTNCGILDVQYKLLINAYVTCGKNPQISIPIIIGNVPLQESSLEQPLELFQSELPYCPPALPSYDEALTLPRTGYGYYAGDNVTS